MGSNESRFSRWFRSDSPNQIRSEVPSSQPSSTRNDSSVSKGNRDAAPASNTPADINGPPQGFMEFLQRSKLANAQNDSGPPSQQGLPLRSTEDQHQKPQHSKSDSSGQAAGAAAQIHSVEELEARMRQAGPPGNNEGNNLSPLNGMRNSQQQDMLAFKKILEQISNDNVSPQPSGSEHGMHEPMHPAHQSQQQQSHQQSTLNLIQMLNKNNHAILGPQLQPTISAQQQHHHHPPASAQLTDLQKFEEFKKAFIYVTPVQRQLPNNQPAEVLKNVMIEQQQQQTLPASIPAPPFAVQQNRMEILKRPEAQVLLQREYYSCTKAHNNFEYSNACAFFPRMKQV